jgi:hypothetical protein
MEKSIKFMIPKIKIYFNTSKEITFPQKNSDNCLVEY